MTRILIIIISLVFLSSCNVNNKTNSGVNKDVVNDVVNDSDDGTTLKILNYNIRTDISLMTRNPDAWVQKIVDAIIKFNPDIVGLVEVEESIQGLDNIPQEIEKRLNEKNFKHYSKYEVRFNQVEYDGEFGMMIISKVPIKDYIGYRPQYLENIKTKDKDLIQSFTYEKDDLKFRFFNYHPHPGSTAQESTDFLLEHLQDFTDSELKIISGDFNLPISSPYMSNLLRYYRNACDESPDKSCEYTYDKELMTGKKGEKGKAIDHILISNNAPVKVEVVSVHCDHNANDNIPVSDHFPVYGIFKIK